MIMLFVQNALKKLSATKDFSQYMTQLQILISVPLVNATWREQFSSPINRHKLAARMEHAFVIRFLKGKNVKLVKTQTQKIALKEHAQIIFSLIPKQENVLNVTAIHPIQ